MCYFHTRNVYQYASGDDAWYFHLFLLFFFARPCACVYIYIYAYNPKKEVDVEADSRDWDRSEGRSFREKMKEQNYSYNFSQPCCEVSVVKVKSTFFVLFFGLNYKYNIYFDSFHQCEYRSVKQMY